MIRRRRLRPPTHQPPVPSVLVSPRAVKAWTHSHNITDRERHYIDFIDGRDIEFLNEYLALCRGAGLETRWIDSGLEGYKRLLAANIHTPHELRCALRELVPHLRKKQEDDPVLKAEQQLIGKKLPGFFPTPRPVISRMLELAEIREGDRVLEPSAGKGDILDMIREQHLSVSVTAIELNKTLFDVLEAKGHDVNWMDFLVDYSGEHDVIVMNPPFEGLQDIAHVQHAYKQLASGGRLVAVMSAGPFFRSDKKAEEFRAWIEEIGGEVAGR